MISRQDELPFGEDAGSLLAPLPEEQGEAEFIRRVWEYHRRYRRSMEWRDEITPYGVFVSEVMLQQTQVARVRERYPRFLTRFPSFDALAAASLREVLEEWSGLGYNRRARFLREAAGMVVDRFGGVLPKDPAVLEKLPGIGSNTAGSIAAFAWNRPTIFFETNIRTVYIFYFFHGETGVGDEKLRPLLEATLDRERPREWYYAVMDLGVYIKGKVGNITRQSRSYARQSPFRGSLREVRGALLGYLASRDHGAGERELLDALGFEPERLRTALERLTAEGFILAEEDGVYRIP